MKTARKRCASTKAHTRIIILEDVKMFRQTTIRPQHAQQVL
jgi:hypothetical protein